jgi:predicted PurR-regulated permease PerM
MDKQTTKTYPIYIKATFLLLLGFLVFRSLTDAEFILVPLTLGSLFAILLIPIADQLEKRGVHRSISSFLCIVIMALVVTALVFMLSRQIISFMDQLPSLTTHMNRRLNEIQCFIEKQTNLSPASQITWLKSKLTTGSSVFSGALSATTSTFASIALVPLYTFFMLFYRDRIFVFFEKITPKEQHETVYQIIERIKALVQNYLTGILIVMFIISVIVSVGLEVIGVPYAIFLGVLAGLINVIPYLGIASAATLSIIISAIMTDSETAPIFVFFLFLFTHLIEANIITPNIVGSKVSINTLASLLALIVGAEVWGIVGMILFIPMLGIAKVIMDNVDHLEPYGYLLSKMEPGKHSITWRGTFKRVKNSFSKKKKS